MTLLDHIPKNESRAAVISLSAAILLLGLKFAAYFLTGSAAVFSDALESVVNVVGAGVTLYALWLAHRPADRDHPYGHGKVEFISGGLEGGMILVAAFVAAVNAIVQLIGRFPQHPAQQITIAIILILVALVANGAVGGALVRIGKSSGSAALVADGRHLLSDAVTSVGALVGLLGVRFTGLTWIDPAIALAVSLYIAIIGIGLLKGSIGGLMDQQDLADEKLLRKILNSHIGPQGKSPRICSFHKLRHRHSGRYHWVDFHIMLPAHWDIRRGHEIASTIEYEIEQALGEGNATAHIEPCAETGCGECAEAASPTD